MIKAENMKKALLLVMLLAEAMLLEAQDIRIVNFTADLTDLTASIQQVKDNTGTVCAVVKLMVRNKDYIIEPNLGLLKRQELPGEIRLWIPKGTKFLTIRRQNLLPLDRYDIPVKIESGVTYKATLELTEAAEQQLKANKKSGMYIGAGYNIMSIAGPAVALGFDAHHHQVELGLVYGLNKTDKLFFYDSKKNFEGAYEYHAMRLQLRYGYDYKVTDYLSLIPQAGGGLNIVSGSPDNSYGGKSNNYDAANSMSLFGALRLAVAPSSHVTLYITPEYDFGVYQSKNSEWIGEVDNTFKQWTNGFNLNIGIIAFF